jgi:hypothetical protein
MMYKNEVFTLLHFFSLRFIFLLLKKIYFKLESDFIYFQKSKVLKKNAALIIVTATSRNRIYLLRKTDIYSLPAVLQRALLPPLHRKSIHKQYKSILPIESPTAHYVPQKYK